MTTAAILRRWISLDRALAGEGLELGQFAKAPKIAVNEKTIRRDLAAFRALGQKMFYVKEDGCPPYYVWHYDESTQSLFSQNLKVRRERVGPWLERLGQR